MTKIIGWAVEHLSNKTVDTRYVRTTKSEAEELLQQMQLHDFEGKPEKWRKSKIIK